MNRGNIIQTTRGAHQISRTDRILVHEHVFNRYPFHKQEEMERFVIDELTAAYKCGITVACDLTAYTQPYNYYRIIAESPVEIVSCLGFYTPKYVPTQYSKADALAIIKQFSKKIENGVGTKKIKPGILKIAANRDSLSEQEIKQFRIIATISKEYNLPIALHAPHNAYEHVCRLLDYGAAPGKVFVAHLESGISNPDEFAKKINTAHRIIKLGSYIQLADFGCVSNSPKCELCVSFACELMSSGLIDHLLLSGDSSWRWKSAQFVVKEFNHGNGKHYTYTMDYSLPILQSRYSKLDLEQLFLLNNPSRLWE